jgi:hypothetical protein
VRKVPSDTQQTRKDENKNRAWDDTDGRVMLVAVLSRMGSVHLVISKQKTPGAIILRPFRWFILDLDSFPFPLARRPALVQVRRDTDPEAMVLRGCPNASHGHNPPPRLAGVHNARVV